MSSPLTTYLGLAIKGCPLYGLCTPTAFSKAAVECRALASFADFRQAAEKKILTAHIYLLYQ